MLLCQRLGRHPIRFELAVRSIARLTCIFAATTLLGFAQDGSGGRSSSPDLPRAVVEQYCIACHNSTTKTANLALDAISRDEIGNHSDAWEKVVRKMRARQMPPPGLPRPDEDSYRAVVASLESSLDEAAVAHPNPGRTDTFRRLNRTEYHNAVRDLLTVDVDVDSLLPGDESSHGFDNVTVGDLSPTLLDRYVAAAENIGRIAVGRPSRSPGGQTIRTPPDLTQEDHIDGLPIGTRGGAAFLYQFPLDGEYEFTIRLTRDRNEDIEGLTEPHEIELLVDNKRVELFTVEPPLGKNPAAADAHLKIRVPVAAGPHEIGAAFLKKSTKLIETERQPYQAHFNYYRHPRIQPAVYSLSIVGPYDVEGPGDTPSRRSIFSCRPQQASEEDACARQILATLIRRAYRRPVTDADIARPFEFYQQTKQKQDFEAGIEMALRAVLVSPEFLFRVEQDPAGIASNSAYRVSDVELASRLSFFLWSSIPDDELLDTAVAGKLSQPGVLAKQVRRMLADQRSEALVTNFASQWLYLRNLESITPDMREFPDFDDNLRQAFRTETEMFFESIVRENRSVLDLLSADYTFVNERLAKHYGIPEVYGSRFRRITLEDGSHRGGLLRQGSILTVTSYATRTSPVIRGKWVLSNVLGIPPPPPLPDVPALDKVIGKNLSMRERLGEHRANPVCASCHDLMDPIGFSLENYDAIGRWRTTDADQPIDVSGGLPDGSKFKGVAGLEKALLARPELFAGSLTEKLLTYATGRGVETYDAPAVRNILRTAQAENFRFSSLVLGIAQSTPFQMRRSR